MRIWSAPPTAPSTHPPAAGHGLQYVNLLEAAILYKRPVKLTWSAIAMVFCPLEIWLFYFRLPFPGVIRAPRPASIPRGAGQDKIRSRFMMIGSGYDSLQGAGYPVVGASGRHNVKP